MSTENRPLGVGLPFSFPAIGAVILVICAGLVWFTPKGQMGDAEFVAKAASGGMFEVESSKLASRSSKRDDVKQFAQEMISEHGEANKGLAEAATEAGHELPSKMMDSHEKMLSKVKEAQIADFDEVYISNQIKAHEEAVALFTTASKSLTNPILKAFAAKTLPTVKEHLEQIKQARK